MLELENANTNLTLSEHVSQKVRTFLQGVDKNTRVNLYQVVLEEVETPLFRSVMEQARYNQSKAARLLGISRGTLRTKLKRYFDDEFIGTREDEDVE